MNSVLKAFRKRSRISCDSAVARGGGGALTAGLYFCFFAGRFAREPRRRSEGVGFLDDIGGGGGVGSHGSSELFNEVQDSPNPNLSFLQDFKI